MSIQDEPVLALDAALANLQSLQDEIALARVTGDPFDARQYQRRLMDALISVDDAKADNETGARR